MRNMVPYHCSGVRSKKDESGSTVCSAEDDDDTEADVDGGMSLKIQSWLCHRQETEGALHLQPEGIAEQDEALSVIGELCKGVPWQQVFVS